MEGFWDRVDKSEDCWEWPGAHTSAGYGVVHAFGRSERAHRVAYTLEYGRIPDGLIVCHRCDNPACVRPDHLFLGTDQDNSDDKWSKDRGVIPSPMRGESNPQARLTAREVDAIRAKYAEGGVSQQAIGVIYGISQRHVCRIVRQENWSSGK